MKKQEVVSYLLWHIKSVHEIHQVEYKFENIISSDLKFRVKQ